MKKSGCLVLPSLFENWGVVIHEACAAGLPIIATYICGATANYLRDGVNGYIVPPHEAYFTEAMLKISELGDTELHKMSLASYQLSKIWTPRILAEYFHLSIKQRISK
jgi:glycosyltransferase involved in cell wall biosynthesis